MCPYSLRTMGCPSVVPMMGKSISGLLVGKVLIMGKVARPIDVAVLPTELDIHCCTLYMDKYVIHYVLCCCTLCPILQSRLTGCTYFRDGFLSVSAFQWFGYVPL